VAELTGNPGWNVGDARARSKRLTLPWRRDLHRDAMLVIGLLVAIAQVTRILPTPGDAQAYWLAGTSSELYPDRWSQLDGGQFLFYPPPVAQISTLLQPIGWSAFLMGWTILIFACFWYCAGRWSLPLVAIGLLPVVGIHVPYVETFLGYALLGNMQWILAALVIVSIRHSAGWAGLVVTKTGPAIGGLWHVFRGEWRAAGVAAASTIAVVAVSFAFAPHLWTDWIAFAIRNYDLSDPPQPLFPIPFGLRLAIAAILLLWGARTNRAWTVPIAAGWAIPALYGMAFLPFWIAASRLTRGTAARSHLDSVIRRIGMTSFAPPQLELEPVPTIRSRRRTYFRSLGD